MISTGENSNLFWMHFVDQPVLSLSIRLDQDPLKFMFKRLGLADAGKRIALRFPDHANQSKGLRPI
jgi:hypothetical protein